MIPPLRPNSFKSNVNRYDTETSNETLPIPSLNDTTMMPAPSNKSTRKRGYELVLEVEKKFKL